MIGSNILLKIILFGIPVTNCLILPERFRGSNRFFLDSAVVADWNELLPLGLFHGVNTNPGLMEEAGHKIKTVEEVQVLAMKALSINGCNEFMVHSGGGSCSDMYRIGIELSDPDRDRIVIKVPLTFEGTKAASRLINSGVRVCMTPCYSSEQVIVAAGIGAEYISYRLGSTRRDEKRERARMQEILNGMDSPARILVGNTRDIGAMADLCTSGVNTFALDPNVARQFFDQ